MGIYSQNNEIYSCLNKIIDQMKVYNKLFIKCSNVYYLLNGLST